MRTATAQSVTLPDLANFQQVLLLVSKYCPFALLWFPGRRQQYNLVHIIQSLHCITKMQKLYTNKVVIKPQTTMLANTVTLLRERMCYSMYTKVLPIGAWVGHDPILGVAF